MCACAHVPTLTSFRVHCTLMYACTMPSQLTSANDTLGFSVTISPPAALIEISAAATEGAWSTVLSNVAAVTSPAPTARTARTAHKAGAGFQACVSGASSDTIGLSRRLQVQESRTQQKRRRVRGLKYITLQLKLLLPPTMCPMNLSTNECCSPYFVKGLLVCATHCDIEPNVQ